MKLEDSEQRYRQGLAAKPAVQEEAPEGHVMVTDILNRAGMLARSGNLLQAERLLGTLSATDSSRIEVIGLLAKVYAQQGKTDEAQALWLKALERDPSNIHVLSALTLCAYQKKPRVEQFVRRYMWLLIAIVLWFLLAVAAMVSMIL